MEEFTVCDDALDALIRTVTVVDHPYQQTWLQLAIWIRERRMRTLVTALWPLEQPAADVGVGVFLGEVKRPALADLVEGERVLLVEPNELEAEGTLLVLELDGRRVRFAAIGDPDAIRVIYPESPETPTSTRRPSEG